MTNKTKSIRVYHTTYVVDENAQLSDMQNHCPTFFKTKFGKQETYSTYRGCLIVRYTIQFTNEQPKRHTVPYLYGYSMEDEHHDTFCLGTSCPDIQSAKQLIDDVLESGVAR